LRARPVGVPPLNFAVIRRSFVSAEKPNKRDSAARKNWVLAHAAHLAWLPGSRWKAPAGQRVSLGGHWRAKVGAP
jgi:hypothetical protein